MKGATKVEMETQEILVFTQLKQFLHDHFGLPQQAIQWESDLIDDLGLTVLQFSELTLQLEQEYDFELKGSEAFNLTSVGQLVNYIILHADTEENQ
jgi:acyl carrier protein